MTIVKCPTCKKDAEFSSKNKFRPFCSERCSVLDLGAWAEEKFRVEGEPVDIEVNQKQNEDAQPTQTGTKRSIDSK